MTTVSVRGTITERDNEGRASKRTSLDVPVQDITSVTAVHSDSCIVNGNIDVETSATEVTTLIAQASAPKPRAGKASK